MISKHGRSEELSSIHISIKVQAAVWKQSVRKGAAQPNKKTKDWFQIERNQ